MQYRYENERYNSKNLNRIQETIEYILTLNYGDVILFETMAKMLNYNIEDEKEKAKFRNTMQKVKNFLINYGYILKSVVNVGYYILKPQQIASYTYRTYIQRPLRLFEKADIILEHTDITKLKDARFQEYKEVRDLNLQAHENLENTINVSDYKKNKYIYDNLED